MTIEELEQLSRQANANGSTEVVINNLGLDYAEYQDLTIKYGEESVRDFPFLDGKTLAAVGYNTGFLTGLKVAAEMMEVPSD